MATIAHNSMKLVSGLGFSSGWAELALKKPPPFEPSCLIASWLATGPPGIVCSCFSSVVTVSDPVKFWITPPAMSATAMTNASGRRIRVMVRVRSTQKLPRVVERRRTRPRMMATMTAMPAAAETKFWTVRPIIWERWLIDTSPLYACQLVLVTKLTAVFQATAGEMRLDPGGVPGQVTLEPEQPVERDHRDGAERQERQPVGRPALFGRRVDAAQPVDEPLDRPEDLVTGSRQRLTAVLGVLAVHLGHVPAEERRA